MGLCMGQIFARAFDTGQLVEESVVPVEDPQGRMPLYVDAEQGAWLEMKRLGVPPELRYLRVTEVEMSKIPDGGKANAMVVERPDPAAPVRDATFRYRIPAPRTEVDGPPGEYSVYEKEARRLYDVHVIRGTPDQERVEHLLGVFDQIARRKPRPSGHRFSPVVTPWPGGPVTPEALRTLMKSRYDALASSRQWAYSW